MSQSDIITLLLIFGGVVSLQFFQGRKINILLMRYFIKGFEENLKPKDKLYTYIGGYVGFKVNYKIENETVSDIFMTLTLLPRQSLLYYPFSLLTRKHDRLYVLIKLKKKLGYDAHIIKKYFYFPTPPLENIKAYNKDEVSYNNKKFYLFYKNKDDIKKLEKLMKKSLDTENVRHFGYTRETNVLFLLLKPDPKLTPNEIRILVKDLSNLS